MILTLHISMTDGAYQIDERKYRVVCPQTQDHGRWDYSESSGGASRGPINMPRNTEFLRRHRPIWTRFDGISQGGFGIDGRRGPSPRIQEIPVRGGISRQQCPSSRDSTAVLLWRGSKDGAPAVWGPRIVARHSAEDVRRPAVRTRARGPRAARCRSSAIGSFRDVGKPEG